MLPQRPIDLTKVLQELQGPSQEAKNLRKEKIAASDKIYYESTEAPNDKKLGGEV